MQDLNSMAAKLNTHALKGKIGPFSSNFFQRDASLCGIPSANAGVTGGGWG
jgi:hypothetical protein